MLTFSDLTEVHHADTYTWGMLEHVKTHTCAIRRPSSLTYYMLKSFESTDIFLPHLPSSLSEHFQPDLSLRCNYCSVCSCESLDTHSSYKAEDCTVPGGHSKEACSVHTIPHAQQ